MSYGSCKPSCRDSQMPDRWWVRWCWWWQTIWNWITYVQYYYHPILLWGPTSPGRPAQWGTLSRLSGTAPTAAWLRARVMDLLRTMVRLSSSSSWLMARTLVTAIQHFLILYFALKNQRCLFALDPRYCSFGIWFLGLKMFHRMHLQWPHPARIWRVPANGLNLFHHHHHHDHHHHHHQNHSHYHPNVFIFHIVATTITFATTHIHIHHRCTIIIWSRHFKKPPGKVWCLVLCRQFKLLLLLVQVFDRILLGNIMILVFRWLGG